MRRDHGAQLRKQLRELRTLVGEPTLRELVAASVGLEEELKKSTVGDLFNPKTSSLPRWPTVRATVQACANFAKPRDRNTYRRLTAEGWFDLAQWWERWQHDAGLDETSSASPSSARSSSPSTQRLNRMSALAAAEAGSPLETSAAASAALKGPDPQAPLRGLYVPRRIENDLATRIAAGSVTVVTGEPGVGKTSLLWHQSEELTKNHRRWLFFRAIDLVPGRPAESSAHRVGLDELEDAVYDTLAQHPPVILVDTIDLLWRSDEGRALLLTLLERAESWPTAVVLTCRDQEYADLARSTGPALRANQQVKLGSYATEELDDAIDRHARHFLADINLDPRLLRRRILHAATRGLPLREIVSQPLTLRMLFETHREALIHAGSVSAPGAEPEPSTFDGLAVLHELDISDLYGRYWELRVCRDARVGAAGVPEQDATTAAEFVALVMLSFGRPIAELTDEVASGMSRAGTAQREELQVGLANLTRRRVLVENQPGQAQFMHQTLFEYAAARALDRMSPHILRDLAERVRKHPADLFLAAVVQQLLVHSCLLPWEAEDIDEFFSGLLTSSEPAHRQLAATAAAMARYRGARTVAAGRDLLRADAGLARRYLAFVPRARHGDMAEVSADLTAIWQAHTGNVRPDVLRAVAACAVQDETAAQRLLLSPGTNQELAQGINWLEWFDRLEWRDAQRERGAPLAVIEAIAEADQEWAADHLVALVAIVIRGSASRDALASVLTTAARVLNRPDDLKRVLDSVPESDQQAPSGVEQLRLALAGLVYKRWAALGKDPITVAKNLCETAEPWRGDPQRVLHQAQWVALAELGLALPPERAEALLTILLGSYEPSLQTDIAERALPRLLEGPYRVPLPGLDSHETASPAPVACIAARDRCGSYLPQLPLPAQATGGRRPVATTCRAAFDQSLVPPAVIAQVLQGAFPEGVPDELWLDADGLASLLVRAALGGHRAGQEALAAWAARASNTTKTVDKIIIHRLAREAERGESTAWPPLLQHAARTKNTHFVRRTVEHEGDRGRVMAEEHLQSAARVAAELIQDADQHVRGEGYELLAELLLQRNAPPVPAETVLRALSERQLQVVKKGLTLVERVLDQQPEHLAASTALADIERALRGWTQPGGSATPEVVARSWRCLGDLFCRVIAVDDEEDRRLVLAEARRLSLNEERGLTRTGYWYLVARLAGINPEAARDELLEASRAVHQSFGAERSSWRQRWARAAHRAVLAVVSIPDSSGWVRLIRDLVPLDQALLAVVVEVSAEQRSVQDLQRLDSLLPKGTVDASVTERLRLARQRRERHTGSATTWPSLVTRWRELVIDD